MTPTTLTQSTSNSLIPQQLDQILANRKSDLAKADGLIAPLELTVSSIKSFVELSRRLHGHYDPELAAAASNLTHELSNLETEGRELGTRISRLRARFSRKTINIGVVGRPKQGKSTLLKALSGLGDDVIPTHPDFCTGAASSLINDESFDTGEALADIEFHSERTFLRDVVQPYWKQTSPDLDLGVRTPGSLDEFASMQLPESPGSKCTEVGTGKRLLDELKRVQEHFPRFRSDLNGGKKSGILLEQIRGFVAQTDHNSSPLYRWRAVKKAEIRCAFPYREAGRICLIDTPGLGQIAIGLEDYVRETLGNDLDFSLFIRRGETGDQTVDSDIRLYDLVGNSIQEIDISKWSACVINRESRLKGELTILNRNISLSPMKFEGGIRELDASDEDEARKELESVLAFLTTQLPKLDTEMMEKVMDGLLGYANRCQSLMHRAANVFPETTIADQNLAKLQAEFDRQWGELATGLRGITQKFRDETGDIEVILEQALGDIQVKMEQGANIDMSAETNAINQQGPGPWFANKQHALHVSLTSLFHSLDLCLDHVFDQMRQQVLEILGSKNKGAGWGSFLDVAEDKDHWESLILLVGAIGGGEQYSHCFRRFSKARLSFSGFIQHRIMGKLGPLDEWEEENQAIYGYPGPNEKAMLETLKAAWDKAGSDAYTAVSDMIEEVGNARWAFTAEFSQAIRRTGGSRTAEQFWLRFYESHRGQIWPEAFEMLVQDAIARAEWSNHIKETNSAVNALAIVSR